jgi:hypothetical protein
MAVGETIAKSRALDKRVLRQSVVELQARLGLQHDPRATGEEAQAAAIASGLKPEECVLSKEILRARQEKEL